jgi:Caspase domain
MSLLRWLACFLAFLTLAALTCGRAEAAPSPMRRIAVVVGANDPPPGRAALRYAHDDATELAAVLEQVGEFAPADVHLLLDPTPAALLGALDDVGKTAAAQGGDVLFVFYYSGHSDGAAIFPHGESVALADVRSRVEHLGARIRVGILDTCRGGSWTQSKGLSVGPPLGMADLMNLDTEGTALVSSSSGMENAHEAGAIQGSFFTHYLTAGLRGAADRAGDGNVTLQEAFDYARERTVRDSARLTVTPQHPSFDLSLRGRQDIVLSVLTSRTSAMQVTAARADIEIIQLPSGITVADAPSGPTGVRIALPPGRYLLRSVVDGRVYTKEVEVRPGETAVVADGQLEQTNGQLIAMKGAAPSGDLSLWGPAQGTRWLLHLGVGMGSEAGPTANVNQSSGGAQTFSSFNTTASLWYRVTDRLSWNVPWPAFSYRFGDPGGVEVMPYIGLAPNSWNSSTGLSLGFRSQVSARIWTTHNQWVSLAAGGVLPVYRDGSSIGLGVGEQIDPFARVGYGWTIRRIVTLHGDVGVDRDYAFGSGGWNYEAEWLRVSGGIAVQVAPHVALDLSTGWSTETHANLGSYEGFMFGTTVAF